MKTLASILHQTTLISGMPENAGGLRVIGLSVDSRKVSEGDVFFAFSGHHHDGNRYAMMALQAGAVAVVSEQPEPAQFPGHWVQVSHGRKALGSACASLYADLLPKLRMTGITGTNGKTTTAWLLDAILRFGGEPTCLIGTVLYRLGDEILPAPNTTPESNEVFRLGAELIERGGQYLTMEVSSHGLALGRAHAIPFETAVFTNFTQDHLDFHGSLDEYFQAKCHLFSEQRATPPKSVVLNADDSAVSRTPVDRTSTVIRFGLNDTADLRARDVQSTLPGATDAESEASPSGLRFDVEWQGKWQKLTSPLLGEFNVHNLLAAYGAALAMGISREQIHEALAKTTGVPGRFERVDQGQPFTVIVDYAHTPDALHNVTQAAKNMKPRRLLTVFGCGGDRDRGKRPRMGEAVAALSDFVILTSDNPRSEDPKQIMEDALPGIQRFGRPCLVEADRREAIRQAIAAAQPGELVLIAGKGHENYQIFADRTIHFDDREVAAHCLAELGYGGKELQQ